MSAVLVTGANGFVGRHLVPALHEQSHQVMGVMRTDDATIAERLTHTWPTLGLIADDLRDVDTVIHLAGMAHAPAQGADRAALFNVNVDQSVNLYRQAVAAGVRRFIWLSSIKVLGDRSAGPLSVDAPYLPGDDYAASKVDAEKCLLAEPAGDTALCIVRPPLVYGPGVKANFLSMLRYATSVWPLPLASALAPRAWLGVHNLVDLLLHLLENELVVEPRIWHVRDAEESSVRDMLELIATQAGHKLKLWRCPPALAMGGASLIGQGARAARLFEPLQVDMQQTESLLGWQPPHSQAQQIEETVGWYQSC